MDNIMKNMPIIDDMPIGYIRFLHAIPEDITVDIYVNGKLLLRNVNYQDFSLYYTAIPGTYNIRVYKAGTTKNAIVTKNVKLNQNTIYTCCAIGCPNEGIPAELDIISDNGKIRPENKGYMRFCHISPNSPAVDIYINDVLVVSGIEYEDTSNYLALNECVYSMKIKAYKTDDVILSNPKVEIKTGNYYTTYVVGLLEKEPSLQVLIPLEGASYLEF